MPRESAADKARRLLVEARVTVIVRDRHHLQAEVRSDSGVEHHVTHDQTAGWRCTCEATAYRSVCSHVMACQLITVTNRRNP